ncbi:AAA family ATPase [Pseudomonas sp. CC120222-01a]|uniref:AAA family ATPase n=1 Tax=Pseudomonas sp. CC120222-01a TaxID=1378075 RepID=UPI000D986301|nr:AAA family ATPase [Pseudomonas sp. CC120222-01a]PVZ43913.1 putative ATP-binding protein involved in virulence [Pseudomonas sp. CC120222-01a]
MKFDNLKLYNWRQFSDVEIDFHPKMTIITGANGAGKTTILKLLSQHFGWNHYLLATPTKVLGQSSFVYKTGFFKALQRHNNHTNMFDVGKLSYSNEIISDILIPSADSAQYATHFNMQQQIYGISINSHRPVQNYQAITSIPTTAISAEQAFNNYNSEIINKFSNGYSQYSTVFRMKETIISMAMFGAGNEFVQKNEELAALFQSFKNVLSEVLPPSIGFIDINVRIPDVVLVTKTGDFMIDAASGGLMSLLDLAWQIFLYSINKSEFTVLLDEPENHLHPSMQRTLLSRLTAAFPNAQFIIATHSPFMVSSVKDSTVYALHYVNEDIEIATPEFSSSKVRSVRLNLDSRAATANEILRDVLGVPISLPQWAENDLRTITSSFTAQSITAEGIARLRNDLEQAGLSEYYPEALKMAADRQP